MTRTKPAKAQTQQDLFRAIPIGGRRWHELPTETRHAAVALIARMLLEKHQRDRSRLSRGSEGGEHE